MTQTAVNYGRVLFELQIPEAAIEESRNILKEVPEVGLALTDPVIMERKKFEIIRRIFPAEIVNFLKVACKNQQAGLLGEIFEGYEDYACSMKHILRASVICVTPPTSGQAEKIRKYLQAKFGKQDVVMTVRRDPSLMGGFILKAEGREIDRSVRGRLLKLSQLAAGNQRR